MRFRGKLCVVWCDGEQHRTRMLSLGLHSDQLPQFAINTKDGRQLPFGKGLQATEAALSKFVADFLGERLIPTALPSGIDVPKDPASGAEIGPGESMISASGVLELSTGSFERIAMDPRKDVLVQLYREVGCKPCSNMVVYYNK
jgi:hypothetical protein